MPASSISASQFSFVPRHADAPESLSPEAWSGAAGREFAGPTSVAPIARGAFSSADRATAFRHQGENVLGHGSKTLGSWLFKSE